MKLLLAYLHGCASVGVSGQDGCHHQSCLQGDAEPLRLQAILLEAA